MVGFVFTGKYAVRQSREHAVACLPEPADIDELKGAVIKAELQLECKQRAYATFRQTRQHTAVAPLKISIPVLDGYIFVNSEDIIRCEGAGSYSWFYMADGKKIMVSLRLKECEDILREHTFFRLHRSHMVNTRYIARYTHAAAAATSNSRTAV